MQATHFEQNNLKFNFAIENRNSDS